MEREMNDEVIIWDWKKTAKKGVKAAVFAAATWAASKGFELTADQQALMVGAGVSAFISLADTLKRKWPKRFWWL
jgi:hypothetical protein